MRTRAACWGLIVRDAPKKALITMGVKSRGGTAHRTMNTPRGVFMERGDSDSLAATMVLVLRSSPQASVSKDGRGRGEGRT